MRVDGLVVDPILDTSGFRLLYEGPDLMQGVNAPGAYLSSEYSWPYLYYADLRNANLEGAIMNNAELSYASFRSARLANVNLNYADMRGVDMTGAHVSPTSLWEANLFEALLTDAVFANSRLKFANLSGANLDGTNFQDADLSSSLLGDAYVEEADFRGADLTGAFYLGTTTGSAFYNSETRFEGTGFDPAAAGWRLVPEPGAGSLGSAALLTLHFLAGRRQARGRGVRS
jgi:uncharacterized protein YjbI with pentapeptide repeats